MRNYFLILLAFIVSTIIGVNAKEITVQVIDKNDEPIADAPVYVEISSKHLDPIGPGPIPLPRFVYQNDSAVMYKTNSDGEVDIDIKTRFLAKEPRIEIRIGLVGRYDKYPDGPFTFYDVGGNDGVGSFVSKELFEIDRITPDNIPSKIAFKTRFADKDTVYGNIQKMLVRLKKYPYIPGYKDEL